MSPNFKKLSTFIATVCLVPVLNFDIANKVLFSETFDTIGLFSGQSQKFDRKFEFPFFLSD